MTSNRAARCLTVCACVTFTSRTRIECIVNVIVATYYGIISRHSGYVWTMEPEVRRCTPDGIATCTTHFQKWCPGKRKWSHMCPKMVVPLRQMLGNSLPATCEHSKHSIQNTLLQNRVIPTSIRHNLWVTSRQLSKQGIASARLMYTVTRQMP